MLISDNKDFTVYPRLYADKKLLLQSEYRQKGLNSNFVMDGSFVNKNNNSIKVTFLLMHLEIWILIILMKLN